MQDNSLISPDSPLPDVAEGYHAFAKGYEPGSRKTPVHVAWLLESEAIRDGWSVGRFVGSERELITRFAVTRDVLREAVRILEARGSMQMQRGRRGGLRLALPDLDWAAGGFATFLRASGFSAPALRETVASAESLIAQLPQDHLIVRLYRRTLEMLAMSETASRATLRVFHITTRLIQHYAPIPVDGVVLGSEQVLCERFACSRATFRQVLRVLDDLGMLYVQRGRGGGYVLQRPSSLGVVRQIFALLASEQHTLRDLLPMKWSLDLIKLRLAMRALDGYAPESRAAFHESLATILAHPTEPHRWCRLQHALGRAARNPFITTLLWCVVAYDVRMGAPQPAWSEIEIELRAIEGAMVDAIRNGWAAEAEHHQRKAQVLIWELFRRTIEPTAQRA